MSDVMSETTSDTVSDDLQQDLQEALTQCQSIERIQDNTLQKLTRLRENIADTICVVIDGQNECDLDIILDKLYQDALRQVETTGQNHLGSMILTMLDKAEFKYSTSSI